MMPLNFAILKYMTEVERACAAEVIAALRPHYGDGRRLCHKTVTEVLMTAEKNGLLVEDAVALDADGALLVYYRTTEESRAIIKHYID